MSLRDILSRQRHEPKIDHSHPQIIELSKRLRVLQSMPISTEEERALWYAKADTLRKRLYEDFADVYHTLPHEIEHYLVDADIRAKDREYARYQEAILKDLLVVPEEERA